MSTLNPRPHRERGRDRPIDLTRRRELRVRVEPLEVRVLPSFANPLVNNPAADATARNTQSETSSLAFGTTVVTAFNDSGSFIPPTSGITYSEKHMFTPSLDVDAEGLGIGDIDGDGTMEIVLADDNSAGSTLIRIFNQDGSKLIGSFNTRPNFDPDGFAVGDVTGDRKAEIVLADDDPTSIFTGTEVGVFNFDTKTGTASKLAEWEPSPNIDADGLAIGDINGDGTGEIVLADDFGAFFNTRIGIFSATGTRLGPGLFVTPVDIEPDGIGVGDTNFDGKAEVVLADDDASSVFFNTDVGVFSFNFAVAPATITLLHRFTPSPNVDAEGLDVGDVNGDGKADIILADDNGGGDTLVGMFSIAGAAAGTATHLGSFNTVSDSTAGTHNFDPDGFAAGDFNLDGIVELVFADDDPLSFSSTNVGVFDNGIRKKFTGYGRSTDGGATFTDLGPLPNAPVGDGGDPVLARSGSTGTVFLATLQSNRNAGINVHRSTDGGATFATTANAAPGFQGYDFLDKPWLTVDNFAGGGSGNAYMIFRNFQGQHPDARLGAGLGSLPNGIYFTRSTNDGVTWEPAGGTQLAAVGQGANVAVGADHAVYALWRDSGTVPPQISLRKSTDQGATFGAVVPVAALTGAGSNGDLGLAFRSNSFPQVAVNPIDSKQVYVVYNDNPAGADRADVFFVQSSDGGAKWTAPLRVNDDLGLNDQFFPTVSVTPDGKNIFVGWYDRRNDGKNVQIETWGVTAKFCEGQVTFGPNFRVSLESFPPVIGVDPAVDATYMGDYDQASSDNTFFYYSWGDNRLGNPDVRLAKVPVTASFDIVIDAGDDPAPGDQRGDGKADTFVIDMGPTLTIRVNGTVVIRGPSLGVRSVTINGSADADTLDLRNAAGIPVMHNNVETVMAPLNTRTFTGNSPDVAGSQGALYLMPNLAADRMFRWVSNDTVLGPIDTGFIRATRWVVIGNRLVFQGNGAKDFGCPNVNEIRIYGDVLFAPQNRAVIDVTNGARRVRYLISVPGAGVRARLFGSGGGAKRLDGKGAQMILAPPPRRESHDFPIRWIRRGLFETPDRLAPPRPRTGARRPQVRTAGSPYFPWMDHFIAIRAFAIRARAVARANASDGNPSS